MPEGLIDIVLKEAKIDKLQRARRCYRRRVVPEGLMYECMNV